MDNDKLKHIKSHLENYVFPEMETKEGKSNLQVIVKTFSKMIQFIEEETGERKRDNRPKTIGAYKAGGHRSKQ